MLLALKCETLRKKKLYRRRYYFNYTQVTEIASAKCLCYLLKNVKHCERKNSTDADIISTVHKSLKKLLKNASVACFKMWNTVEERAVQMLILFQMHTSHWNSFCKMPPSPALQCRTLWKTEQSRRRYYCNSTQVTETAFAKCLRHPFKMKSQWKDILYWMRECILKKVFLKKENGVKNYLKYCSIL